MFTPHWFYICHTEQYHCKTTGYKKDLFECTVEPLLRDHPDNRAPLFKGHFSGAKGVATQERFHCSTTVNEAPKEET